MKKLLSLIIIIFSIYLSFYSGSVFAQESTPTVTSIPTVTPANTSVQKYGITFPIAELGNCVDLSSCKAYCEDPVNSTVCTAFAKQRGFYKDESTRKDELITKAKTLLGCDSETSCRELCGKQENFDKCNSFAKTNNVSGGHVKNTQGNLLIQKAQQILGCTSAESCKALCQLEENKEKCSQFAKQTGIRGGETKTGPGGCTSAESCKAFCSDPTNYSVCSAYATSIGKKFLGPAGCSSEDSCRESCEKNPQLCKNFGQNQSNVNLQEKCSKTPNCSWADNACKCQPFDKSQITISPKPTGAFNYQEVCISKGCSWANNSCSCPASVSTYPKPTSVTPGTTDLENKCISYGCRFTGSTCDCSNKVTVSPIPTKTNLYDYSTECAKKPNCTWTGTSCSCQSVEGASVQVEPTLLEKIINFIVTLK